ncbi:SOSS complex subunit C-like [Watersipora subatra]|uniref:SOSS complex subunit C-like n=1 Tax=Watersipora subatra TaxID=2589382 RepID=UPI00355B3895
MTHNPIPGQAEENKRILKELDDQKRQLKMKAQGAPVQTQQRPVTLDSVTMGGSSRHNHNRQALHEASVGSFGFYISTDSQFGNPILAVLPRIEPEKKTPP